MSYIYDINIDFYIRNYLVLVNFTYPPARQALIANFPSATMQLSQLVVSSSMVGWFKYSLNLTIQLPIQLTNKPINESSFQTSHKNYNYRFFAACASWPCCYL